MPRAYEASPEKAINAFFTSRSTETGAPTGIYYPSGKGTEVVSDGAALTSGFRTPRRRGLFQGINVGGWGVPQSLGTYLYTLPGVISGAGTAASDPKVAAAALAFLPSVVGLVVMLGGGFYFVSGKPRGRAIAGSRA